MKLAFLLLLFLSFSDALFSQTLIKGRVVDEDGKPIPYVNVFLSGTIEGAMTNEQGIFSFTTKQRGDLEIVASCVGYEKFRKSLKLGEGKSSIWLEIRMKSTIIKEREVVVTASSYSSEKGKGVVLTSMDVLTTPGGAADIYQSLKTLPGLTQVSESAQLYVRGGDPTETLTLIDQASMYNPYTLESPYGGLFSNLNTIAVKSMYFSSGGFSAKYGNVLSGILDIETKDEPSATLISCMVSLAGLGINAEVPLVHERIGMRLDARHSYTKPLFLINGVIDRFTATPFGRDISGNITYRYSNTGRIKISGLFSEDGQSVNVELPEYQGVFEGNSKNIFLNLQHKDAIFGNVFIKTSFSFNRYKNIWRLGILDLTRTDDVLKFRTDVEHFLSTRIKVGFGLEVERRTNSLAGVIPAYSYNSRPDAPKVELNNKLNGIRYGRYVEVEVRKPLNFENFSLIAGVRADYVPQLKLSWFDPRVGLAYKVNKNSTFKLGWGIFHQLPDIRLFNKDTGNPNLKPMRAIHFIAGYDIKFNELNEIRFEIYHKRYDKLPLKHQVLHYDNSGYGYARGIDVMAKGWLGPINGWISYSYIDTKRMWMDDVNLTPSDYDITHNVSIVLKYNFSKAFQLGLNYKYATGKPYTPVIGANYDSTLHVYEPIFGLKNSMRYKDYQRMDIRLTYLTRLFERHFTVVFVEVLNVLNYKNIFGYTYSSDYSKQKEVISFFGRRMLVFGVQVIL